MRRWTKSTFIWWWGHIRRSYSGNMQFRQFQRCQFIQTSRPVWSSRPSHILTIWADGQCSGRRIAGTAHRLNLVIFGKTIVTALLSASKDTELMLGILKPNINRIHLPTALIPDLATLLILRNNWVINPQSVITLIKHRMNQPAIRRP